MGRDVIVCRPSVALGIDGSRTREIKLPFRHIKIFVALPMSFPSTLRMFRGVEVFLWHSVKREVWVVFDFCQVSKAIVRSFWRQYFGNSRLIVKEQHVLGQIFAKPS